VAEYQITYWRDLPSLVTAREGAALSKVELPARFQERIDQVAMDEGLIGSDAYLEGWRRGEWTPGDGSPAELAAAVAARLQQELPE
jgi:Virulence factor